MKFLSVLALSFVLCGAAQAATPTPESVEKLIALSNLAQVSAGMMAQIDNGIRAGMAQGMKDITMTPAQTAAMDNFRVKMVAALGEELKWDNIKALYVQVYSESFSQEEIDKLIAFYESDTGKMVVSKLPQAMGRAGQLMQQRMVPMMERLQVSMKSAIEDMKAASKAAAAAKPAK